ncbi:ABC transporter ATP-binding protein [Stygiolobus caldivivus]|uniref:ABC transporter ATP-binding protein n=1 Tax=Stygiolobus caldivivus TaxID=2824673 RepID=UPI001C845AE1|nr:ABC transporter ATP-binding protein [Stygiolobus caldivivus]
MEVVEAENLTKRYGDTEVLHKVSFIIEEKSITALLGPNGAGKSTLLKIVAGLINRSSGKIAVLGEDPWKNEKLPRYVSILLDKPYLPPFMTVWDVLKEAKSEFGVDYRDVEEILHTLNITSFLKTKIKDLSTGTKQKVQVAFSLLKLPKLVIADEPTANLDLSTRFEVYNTFVKLASEGSAIIIASHLASELISISTHLLGLNNGILRVADRLDRLIKKKDMMEEFYIVVDDVIRAKEYLQSYNPVIMGNQIKVRGELLPIVKALLEHNVKIFYIRNSLLDKTVMSELGWE